MPTEPLVNVDLSGKTALITGGVSGIGLACATRLAQAGATVVIVDLDASAAQAVAEPLGGRGIGADLSDPAALERIDAAGYAADIIVNNAGFQRVAPIEEFDPAVFVAIQKVMVEAPFRLIQASLPRMYERGWGRVVNISSAHGLVASPFKVAYVTAKHGLEGLSKVTAMEGGGHGVTSNCINPGYVRTPLVEKQIADQARTRGIGEDEVIEQVMLQRPSVKRLLEPEEVAELAAYLCSPLADCINGSSYKIDGGWTAN
ncbi:3-hydroxybutyrate dehydrogenase [Cumulibacter manganitolerans]|uniref:3-hydroxybutyrate dehydrogenase n=1 Tax=Cumulibacter manganitolerans TaxID=1884992 RepID=UPI001297A655|nr:3-hydroxybutyrate dehydrogenase [Cumulibacter manganitolerans]